MFSILILILAAITPAMEFPLFSDNLRVIGDYNHATPELAVGERLYLMVPVNNTLPIDTKFTYVTQVLDENGFTDAVTSVNTTITGLRTTYPNNAWFPRHAGNFTIDGYIYSSLDKPELLALPQKTNVTILGGNNQIQANPANSSFYSKFDSYNQSEILDRASLDKIASVLGSCQKAEVSLAYYFGSMRIAIAGVDNNTKLCSLALTFEIEMGGGNSLCSVPLEVMREWHSWKDVQEPSVQEIRSYCVQVT